MPSITIFLSPFCNFFWSAVTFFGKSDISFIKIIRSIFAEVFNFYFSFRYIFKIKFTIFKFYIINIVFSKYFFPCLIFWITFFRNIFHRKMPFTITTFTTPVTIMAFNR